MQGLAFIVFGLISVYNISKPYFILLALIARLFQGLGAACINVAGYSFVSNFYSDEAAKAIVILEMQYGLGMVVGPFFGSTLFWIGGYEFMIMSFSCLLFLCVVVMKIVLPKSDELKVGESTIKEFSTKIQ